MRTVIAIIFCFCFLFGCSEEETENPISKITSVNSVLIVPDDFPTIASAILAAEHLDTVLLRDGVYVGEGNRDIILRDKAIILKSENGPDRTIINCGGDSANLHFGFQIASQATNGTVIDGITIQNAYNSSGSGMFIISSSPVIKNCVFENNRALNSGGAIRCKSSSPIISNCTFVNNNAVTGGSLYLVVNSTPRIRNCIIVNSTQGDAIQSSGNTSIPDISCTNIYNNSGGNWIDKIAEFANINGNFSNDPLFCTNEDFGYHLQDSSTCLPSNNSCNSLIGALSSGCSNM